MLCNRRLRQAYKIKCANSWGRLQRPVYWICTCSFIITLSSTIPPYSVDKSCITTHLFGRYGTNAVSKLEDRYLVDDLSGVKHRAMMYRWIYFRPLMEFLASLRSLRSILLRSKTAHHARGSRVRDYGWNSVQSFKKTEKDTEEGKLHTAGKLFSYEGTEHQLRDTQIASECMDHLVAGVDTT